MSERTDADRQKLAAAFGRDLDPLTQFAETFEETDVDPFSLYVADILDPENPSRSTRSGYDRAWDQWCEHMAREERHPACPNEQHVRRFIEDYLIGEHDNMPRTIQLKIQRLKRVYRYWQTDPGFPHPQDFDPFQLAFEKVALNEPEKKLPPNIPLVKLREIVGGVTNIRDRALIVTPLKLGLRATEVCNIRLEDVSIQNAAIQEHYPEMGTVDALDGRENAIYIPHDRIGNKSKRPRILPLDDEMRRVLIGYLLIRPDAGIPEIFLSKSCNAKIDDKDVNRTWKKAFHPEYAETEQHRAVTSHYGRHRFSTYWNIHQEVNRELVKYMRGDRNGRENGRGREGLDHYLHTYYEDIKELYLDRIYKLAI